MQKYCLVKLLEPLKKGDEFKAINYWPLHITIVSNFTVEVDSTVLSDKLLKLLRKTSSISVTAGDDEFFGRDKSVQVTLINIEPKIIELHNKLVEALNGLGAVFDEPKFNGAGYRAHVTVQKNNRIKKGDRVLVDEVTIIDMFPDNDITKRRVLDTIKLTTA